MKRPVAPTLVSLFAGAGGLDLGLEQAGFNTFFANELEAHACRTLVENQRLSTLDRRAFNRWFESTILAQRCYADASSEVISSLRDRLARGIGRQRWLQHAVISHRDVRTLSAVDVCEAAHIGRGALTLIAGGPPCQPFSRAGKRETVGAESGRLFLEFVRLVDELRPRWFLFENVKGLLLHKTAVVSVRCTVCNDSSIPPFTLRDELSAYNEQLISCSSCGFPARVAVASPSDGSLILILAEFERLGYRCQWRVLNAADFGVPQLRHRLFVVGSRDGETFAWPSPTHKPFGAPELDARQGSMFEQHTPWPTISTSLWKDGHPTFGRLDPTIARLWVKNVVRPHAEPVTWTLDRPAPTVGAHQAAKLALAPEGVPEEQLRRQQWHVKGQRQRDLPPVHVNHEYLSDEELLLLQTFPTNWYLHGTRMQRAFQVGNAVPVLLARAMGRSILTSSGIRADVRIEASSAS